MALISWFVDPFVLYLAHIWWDCSQEASCPTHALNLNFVHFVLALLSCHGLALSFLVQLSTETFGIVSLFTFYANPSKNKRVTCSINNSAVVYFLTLQNVINISYTILQSFWHISYHSILHSMYFKTNYLLCISGYVSSLCDVSIYSFWLEYSFPWFWIEIHTTIKMPSNLINSCSQTY